MRPDAKQEGLRQAMAWLHTYAGLLLGWLLFAVFLTGTLAYVQDEISLWMRPETQRSQGDAMTAQRAVDAMSRLAPGAQSWTIELPDERQPAVLASWRPAGAPATGRGGMRRAVLDAGTGQVIQPRETRGGSFLYRFHFDLYGLPFLVARWLVGIAAFFMLVAIISGVITHKKIFTDFFTFRPRRGQRSWLDAHNAAAVLGLPFHFVLTFSGLLLLFFTLLPWGLNTAYEDNPSRYFAERRATLNPLPTPPQGWTPAADARADIGALLAQARQAWDGRPVGSLAINKPGTKDAIIELRAAGGDSLANRGIGQRLVFAADGTPLSVPAPQAPAFSTAVYNAMVAVHLGRFAGPALRWLFFLSGIAGTLMVATGLVMWVVKRLPERTKRGTTPFSHRAVEVLNVGAIAGLTVAVAVYFWMNRLLPAAMPGRADWEIRGFFIAWLVCALHAPLRRHRRAWMEQLAAAAILLALLPGLNAATGGVPLWQSLATGPAALAAFECGALAIAALLAWAVFKLRSPRSTAAPARTAVSRGRRGADGAAAAPTVAAAKPETRQAARARQGERLARDPRAGSSDDEPVEVSP
jgi:uncharacterized iron-regulated membrane protein